MMKNALIVLVDIFSKKDFVQLVIQIVLNTIIKQVNV